MAELLTQMQIAERLDLDVRQIRNLEGKGLPTRASRGKKIYPWPAGLHWYLRFKVDSASRKSKNEAMERAQLRKLEAQAKLAELEVAQKEERLVDLEYLEHQVAAIAQRLRARMLSIPAKWAPLLVGMRSINEAQARLDEIVGEAMQSMSETGEDPELDAPEDADVIPGLDAPDSADDLDDDDADAGDGEG